MTSDITVALASTRLAGIVFVFFACGWSAPLLYDAKIHPLAVKTKVLLHNYRTGCNRWLAPMDIQTRQRYIAKEKNRKAHLFALPHCPNAHRDGVLCVPQKNGNREFGALVYASRHNRPPTLQEAFSARDMKKWSLKESDVDSNKKVYFIARNPYTRMLSLYRDKVLKSNKAASESSGKERSKVRGLLFNGLSFHENTTFAEFVATISTEMENTNRTLCDIDHHLCPQVTSCLSTTSNAGEVVVMKLEEQSFWFNCFIDDVAMDMSLLRGEEWIAYSGMPCYYAPSGSCSSDASTVSMDTSEVEVATGHYHSTGSSQLSTIVANYDEATAERVTNLYADDFAALGYPKWDGNSSFHNL